MRLLHDPLPSPAEGAGIDAAYLHHHLDCNVPSVVGAAKRLLKANPNAKLVVLNVINEKLQSGAVPNGFGAGPYLIAQLHDAVLCSPSLQPLF